MPLRIKAFLIHLIGSALLACFVLAFVFLIWYPSPLAKAFGVTQIFFLMLGIDVIAGPLLTLFIYKENKKELKYDLAVILIIQLSMFAYGIHTVAAGRPVWFVFNTDQFYAVRAADITEKNRQYATSEFQQIPIFGPKWAAVQLPKDKKQRDQIISNTLQSGNSLFGSQNLYAPINSQITKIQAKAHSINTLQQWNAPEKIRMVLVQSPTAATWLPLWTDRENLTVLLDKSGQVVAITDLQTPNL